MVETTPLRAYQAEIVEQAKSENLIVCLPTGSGKTRIAIMLMKEWLDVTRPTLENRGKRTVLLVKTIELARQHSTSIALHIDNNDGKIRNFCEKGKIDLANKTRWMKEFNEHQILIFTAQAFLNVLEHGLLRLNQVNLLIMDECHHATGDDAYAKIIQNHYVGCHSNRPRLLGLTASITGQKIEPNRLTQAARELELLYQGRIETGADREEILQHSTSVKVEQLRCEDYKEGICKRDKSISNIFKKIQSFVTVLNNYLKGKKAPIQQQTAEDQSRALNFPTFQCRTLDQLKNHLENLLHIGYDLGLYGLRIAMEMLITTLQRTNISTSINDPTSVNLYQQLVGEISSLLREQWGSASDQRKILYSHKVLKIVERLDKNRENRSIIFVERVYTSIFLTDVLKKLLPNTPEIKYVAGSKAQLDGICLSLKYQREVIRDFRQGAIKILISTAILEEGFDLPECNLVIRFNKPVNFSSYMQSKGRARAKSNALFLIIRDESDFEKYQDNSQEYQDYEYMEKMLRQSFQTRNETEALMDDSDTVEEFYRPNNQVQISGRRAMEILYQYCVVSSPGQMLAPRFLFYLTEHQSFKCILTMPANCPIRDDIECVHRNKKAAKYACSLIMLRMLHQIGELDDRCLPISPVQEVSQNEEAERLPNLTIPKQTAYFMHDRAPIDWHLYRIKIDDCGEMGFLIPDCFGTLPAFQIYGRDDARFRVEFNYIKSIHWTSHRDRLQQFSRYLFETVFEDMKTRSGECLLFDIDRSTFKLFPCLLTTSNEIDWSRMATICDRSNRVLNEPSELNDKELYRFYEPSRREYFFFNPDPSQRKNTSDRCDFKKAAEMNQTYADYFESKHPELRIRRNNWMGTMQVVSKPRMNYLNPAALVSKKESALPSSESFYYAIELLRYAPLNRTDFNLISKLPSVLVRLAQLTHLQQLQQTLLNYIPAYTLFPYDPITTMTFKDSLVDLFATSLPLVRLNYQFPFDDRRVYPSSWNLLFQAITRRSAAEPSDMENLEILGDSFLKLAMSLSLYHQYPSDSAGKLTRKKDRQIANKNLFQLTTKQSLEKYLYIDRIVFTGTDSNWIPPGYTKEETIADSDRYFDQTAKGKAFADMIEALIGAFLIATDYGTTMEFMQWVGLPVLPYDERGQICKTPPIISSGLSETDRTVRDQILDYSHRHAFDQVETKFGYDFKNKAYLIAAMTHPSYVNNRLTLCYERLEYLGDAILDFLVVRCIFVENYTHVNPSRVTDIRQDLANNGRLAYLLVCCGLDKKILHASPDLSDQMILYLNDETIFSSSGPSINQIGLDIDKWADSNAPKALADVFEALVGAIFLDSGYSLDTVWKVLQPLLRPYINATIRRTNLNPVRSFFEKQGTILQEYNETPNNFVCKVQLPGQAEHTGYGKNKKLAKYDACRKAMQE